MQQIPGHKQKTDSEKMEYPDVPKLIALLKSRF